MCVGAEHPDTLPYATSYCLTGTFAAILLTEGYGIDPVSSSVVTVAAPNSAYSYAMGAMLWHANALGWSFTGVLQ
jgi:hypothetical protein